MSRWRRAIMDVANDEMLQLARVSNRLAVDTRADVTAFADRFESAGVAH